MTQVPGSGAAPKAAVVTVVTRSHFHRARCLLESVQRHSPEADRFVVLADRDDGQLSPQPFEVIPVESLPVPDVAGFVRRYRAAELSYATKPWALGEMFRRGYDRVIYLDADIVVYSSLRPMLEILDATAILLTPHLANARNGAAGASDIDILQAGAYNSGFVGLARAPAALEFVDWWQRKLLHDCRVDAERGYVGDQRWLDLVPGQFDGVRVVRHPGWNFARWNMAERPMSSENGEIQVGGQPLVFFHFSGLLSDTDSPGQQANPDAGKLAPGVRALVEAYVQELERHGAQKYTRMPFAFAHSPARTRAEVAHRMKASARHLLHAVTTTSFRRRARMWLGRRASR